MSIIIIVHGLFAALAAPLTPIQWRAGGAEFPGVALFTPAASLRPFLTLGERDGE